MSTVKTYKDLIVWQKSILLIKEIYVLTSNFPSEEKFGLIQQLRRAAISIPSNVAEGWGRGSSRNFIQFLRIARGSVYECETQIIPAVELLYCDDASSRSSFEFARRNK